MDTQPDWASPETAGWTIEQAIAWLLCYPWGNSMVAQLGSPPDLQRDPQQVRQWLRRVASLHARLHADAGAMYAIDSGDDNGAGDVASNRAMAADLYD